MKCSWQEGNRITLLVNGDEYYPAVFKAIDNAQQKVILETFIWFEDNVGKQLHSVLLRAVQKVAMDSANSAATVIATQMRIRRARSV
jgi:cardiolipin synthase